MSDETRDKDRSQLDQLFQAGLDSLMRDGYYRALRRQRQQRALREKLRVVSREEKTLGGLRDRDA